MVPIEIFFSVLVFVFALIGLVRGFLRELGVTTVMMFLLFFLSRFEPELDKGLVRLMDAGGRFMSEPDDELIKCGIFTFVLVGSAFVSYEGETLAFGGQLRSGVQTIVLGLLAGALNGYLIAGSLWYYMHKFGYPFEFLGFSVDNLSALAQKMIGFLPMTFLGSPVLFGQSLLLYLSALLLLARVIR
ncbi:MAG: hypothetical protein U9R48_09690 [Chloroflexota bacterium]|nr:hypothetical protein [Chloroflexota bacterium]